MISLRPLNTQEPIGTFGNVKRNLFHGPGFNYSNLEVYKNPPLEEPTEGDILNCDWKHTTPSITPTLQIPMATSEPVRLSSEQSTLSISLSIPAVIPNPVVPSSLPANSISSATCR
jgi:hypothetical protein